MLPVLHRRGRIGIVTIVLTCVRVPVVFLFPIGASRALPDHLSAADADSPGCEAIKRAVASAEDPEGQQQGASPGLRS